VSRASNGVVSEVERMENEEIAAHEDAVVRAGLAFSASIQDASAAGRGTIRRAASVARPVLIGVGVLVVAGLGIGFVRRLPKKSGFLVPTPIASTGPWSELARAVVVAFAAAAGRRLVERWLGGSETGTAAPEHPPEAAPRDRTRQVRA
jgi:hypothetical protein